MSCQLQTGVSPCVGRSRRPLRDRVPLTRYDFKTGNAVSPTVASLKLTWAVQRMSTIFGPTRSNDECRLPGMIPSLSAPNHQQGHQCEYYQHHAVDDSGNGIALGPILGKGETTQAEDHGEFGNEQQCQCEESDPNTA